MTMLDRHDNVFVLDLGDDETRMHPAWIAGTDCVDRMSP